MKTVRPHWGTILSARPSTSTDQRLSKLDTSFSRFSHNFLASIFKGVKCRVTGSLYRSVSPFLLFENSTLANRFQFTFSSSLCMIWSSIWWHTSGENIDIYVNGGTNQQQVSHSCLPVCLERRSKLSLSFQGKVQLLSLFKIHGIASCCKCFCRIVYFGGWLYKMMNWATVDLTRQFITIEIHM